jgi:N-acetylglutamate synthase-like GNAT family acetyltransferase
MHDLMLRTFQPGDEAPFQRLNEDWISKYFAIKAADRVVLSDPRTHILDPGGQICIAEVDDSVVGCCALAVIAPRELELGKMTVAEPARGRGIGRRLLQFAIDEARRMGAHRLYLESNKRVATAVHLYEQLGFRHLPGPLHASKYARADVFMELPLNQR